MAFRVVGKSIPRLEGAEKVSGKTRYAADVDVPEALSAKILRSSLPHARLRTA
jgi:CO/xanthine dehydrogenase Mo-binding subunit